MVARGRKALRRAEAERLAEQSLETMSAGTTSAASALPCLTFSIACARVETRMGSTASKNASAYFVASTVSLPKVIRPWPAATSLTNATFGLSGERDSAKPMSSARITG